jgi:glycosyltransferase involved in cell wall biosynthesis
MFAAVVPVHNEESRVGRLLERLLALDTVQTIFVILNGSNSSTYTEVEAAYKKNKGKITLVSFPEPLGIDVPRAVGAKLACACNADYTLFVDGDLVGEITKELSDFIKNGVSQQLDLALMDCYPHCSLQSLSEQILFFRRLLNMELGVYAAIGIATPSHGPHLISRRMLAAVPWHDYCVPPTLLVHAARQNFKIGIAGAIPHIRLGSSLKTATHSQLITDTISGDCLEAICMLRNLQRSRSYEGKTYLGYHKQRRFDLLIQFLAGRFMR